MNIIKLSAIDSTNDYLKINFSELIKKEIHIAYTFNQTNGKGQVLLIEPKFSSKH